MERQGEAPVTFEAVELDKLDGEERERILNDLFAEGENDCE